MVKMTKKILLKTEIAKLFTEISKEADFYAPINERGNIAFKKISKPEEIQLDYLNSKVPPKDVLFPRMETMFTYKYVGKDVEIEERQGLKVGCIEEIAFRKNFISRSEFENLINTIPDSLYRDYLLRVLEE